MYSKALELVVNRIRQEIRSNESCIGRMYQGKIIHNDEFVEESRQYKEVANLIIEMIVAIDEEIKEREEN